MALALIIESNDERFAELSRFCEAVSSAPEAKQFASAADFLNWIKEIEKAKEAFALFERERTATGNKELKPPTIEINPKDLKVSVLIVSNELMGPENSKLFTSLTSYFTQNSFLADGLTRLPILFVAQENARFLVEPYMNEMFENVMFYPFDKDVCIGKIDWAIRGINALGDEPLAQAEPPHPVELLKGVEIERVTELGFRTHSSQPIPIGSVAKYYLDFLSAATVKKMNGVEILASAETTGGVYAKCISCTPHPDQKELYVCGFSFFAVNQKFIRLVRSFIEKATDKMGTGQKNVMELPNIVKKGIVAPTIISVISEDQNQGSRIREYLSSTFQNYEVYSFNSMLEFQLQALPGLLKESYDPDKLDGPKEVEAVYEVDGATFVTTVPTIDEQKKVFGLSKAQFEKLKPLLLGAVSDEKRAQVLRYFKGTIRDKLTLILREQGETFFLSIMGSADVEVNGKLRRTIKIRYASKEEVSSLASENETEAGNSRILFISQKIANAYSTVYWKQLKEALLKGKQEKISIMVSGAQAVEDHLTILSYVEFDDYFVEPFDPSYLEKKVKQMYPLIQTTEVMGRLYLDIKVVVQTGLPVKLKRISELSASMFYHRSIEPFAFRRLVLVSNAQERQEYLVRSIGFQEEDSEDPAKKFINHFNFFCLGDASNQFVRLWLNEIYQLKAKLEEEAQSSPS